MKLLYYRIYYTIYRALIWFGQSEETGMPRFNVTILMSLFTMLNAAAIIAFLSSFMGKVFVYNNRISTIIFSVVILCFNLYMILYRNRYNKLEKELSNAWIKEKNKNVLITIGYIFFTFLFIGCSLYYIKHNPIKINPLLAQACRVA